MNYFICFSLGIIFGVIGLAFYLYKNFFRYFMKGIYIIFLLSYSIVFAMTPNIIGGGRGGVKLDGVDDWLALPSTATLASTTWTIETWVKTRSTSTATAMIFDSGATPRLTVYYPRVNSGKITVYDGTNIAEGPVVPLDGGNWHHLAITSSNNSYVFDGIPGSFTASISATLAPDFGKKIGSNYLGNAAFFPGSIRDFRIWSVARSQSEIQTNMNARLTGREPGLVFFLPLDDGRNTDPVLPDSVFGSSYAQSDVLSFNGSSDIATATIATAAAYPYTLSQWMYAPAAANTTNYCGLYVASSTSGYHVMSINLVGNGSALAARILTYPSDSAEIVLSNYIISPSTWVYVTGVFESQTSRKLYVNGLLANSTTASKDMPSGAKTVGISSAQRSPNIYNAGRTKNSAVWNRALSQSEIQAEMLRSTPSTTTGLIGYWPLNETNSTPDSNLPIGAFPAFCYDAANPNVLKIGVPDYVKKTGINRTLSQPVTIGCWVYNDAADFSNFGIGSATDNTDHLIIGVKNISGAYQLRTAGQVLTTTLPATKPAFFVTVLNSGVATIYANGNVLLATTSVSLPAAIGPSLQLNVGTLPSGVTNYPGRYKNCFIYNRALSQTEVQAEMIRSTPATTTDLVMYWPLNETTGSTAYDLSPNGYNGTITGGSRVSLTCSGAYDLSPNAYHATITGGSRVSLSPKARDEVSYVRYPAFTGRYESARTLDFDYVNDKWQTGSLTLEIPCSFGGWFYLPSNAPDAGVSYGGYTTCSLSHPALNRRMSIGAFHNNAVASSTYVIRQDSSSGSQINTDSGIPLGSPIHVVLVCSDGSSRSVYVNGRLLGDFTQTPPASLNGFKLNIGSQETGAQLYYGGKYWDHFIYSRALSQSEIVQQMYSDSPVSTTNLLGFWKLDEGQGTTATDYSGNGNHGTITGATWSVLPNNNGTLTKGPEWLQEFLKIKLFGRMRSIPILDNRLQ